MAGHTSCSWGGWRWNIRTHRSITMTCLVSCLQYLSGGDKNPTQVDVTCKGRVFWRGLNVGYRKVSGEKISKFLWAGQNSSDKVTISFRAVKIGKWSRPGQPDQRYYNRCTNKLLTFQPRALQGPVSPSVICPRWAHTGDFAKTSSELSDNFAAVIIMKWTGRENVM